MLWTASAFGPAPGSGSAERETSCSSTYQPRYPVASSSPYNAGDVDAPRPRGTNIPSMTAWRNGTSPDLTRAAASAFDVLEVDVDDPAPGLSGDLDCVAASEKDVTGVEAQADGGRVQQPVDVMGALDGHAPMGMDCGGEAMVGSDLLKAVETGEEAGANHPRSSPTRGRSRRYRSTAPEPESSSPPRTIARDARLTYSSSESMRSVPVQERRHESADDRETVWR